MLNYKSYIVTIVSIFFAIAFGILVGISWSDNILLQQQHVVIERLEERYHNSLDNLTVREDEIKLWEEFNASVFEFMLVEIVNKADMKIISVDSDLTSQLESEFEGFAAKIEIYEVSEHQDIHITEGDTIIISGLHERALRELNDFIVNAQSGGYQVIVVETTNIEQSFLSEVVSSKEIPIIDNMNSIKSKISLLKTIKKLDGKNGNDSVKLQAH